LEAEVIKHRFTVEEFRKMGEAGIFGEDDRVELVEGEIVEMTPIGWRHVESVNALTGVLADLRGADRFVVSVQNPLVLGEHGEHYPDLVLYQAGSAAGFRRRGTPWSWLRWPTPVSPTTGTSSCPSTHAPGCRRPGW
jgi:Uma2 family endonuclease